MAVSQSDVNASQVFKKVPTVDRPVQTFKTAPKISPNPFTGLGVKDAYAKKHHILPTPPATVKEATEA
jgi:hypothetical protein